MKSIIKKRSVELVERTSEPAPAPGAPRASAPPPQGGAHSKVARLVRVEGVVRAIELACTCGETTLVELEYEDAPRANVE